MSVAATAERGCPGFDDDFRARLHNLFLWRRDVRRFKRDPLPESLVSALLEAAHLAPSVGLSQPWRFVLVEAPACRAAVLENYRACNRRALEAYEGEQAKLYAGLKLSGLEEAPVQLAVFCDEGTLQGAGLGRSTMPETLRYSVVTAIQNLWLAARSHDVGVGWVSILDPDRIKTTLAVPESWHLVAYLCVGYPIEEHIDPELERHRWETRTPLSDHVLRR